MDKPPPHNAPPPRLFDPVSLRGVTARNRVVIAPMQQFSADAGGLVSDWHLLHLGRFALGGAGTVFVESTAVEPRGRNTHADTGLWDDAQVPPLARIAAMLKHHGAVPAIQLGHTGRKAALNAPWNGHGPLTARDAQRGEAPWPVVGPSALPVGEGWQTPRALTEADIEALIEAYGAATRRAADAGFELLEIHGAHGYLIHQFLSPLANQRQDAWGGSPAARQRFPLAVARAVRARWPAHLPLAWRLSMTDLDDGTLPLDEMVGFVGALRDIGVDVLDCSSGGGISAYPTQGSNVPRGLEFRARDAQVLRARTGIAILAVGFIIRPQLAQSLVNHRQADLVAIGREALYNPNWPLHARQALEDDDSYQDWPIQHRSYLAKRAPLADAERGRRE